MLFGLWRRKHASFLTVPNLILISAKENCHWQRWAVVFKLTRNPKLCKGRQRKCLITGWQVPSITKQRNETESICLGNQIWCHQELRLLIVVELEHSPRPVQPIPTCSFINSGIRVCILSLIPDSCIHRAPRDTNCKSVPVNDLMALHSNSVLTNLLRSPMFISLFILSFLWWANFALMYRFQIWNSRSVFAYGKIIS